MSPLSPHHRRSLFTSLSPIVGEEEADALLDQLPRTEEEVPAAQADLVALDLSLRSEMATGFADVRGEMRAGFAEIQGEVQTGFAEVRSEMATGLADIRTELRSSQARQTEALAELRGEMHTSVATIAEQVAKVKIDTVNGLAKHLMWTVGAVFGAISVGMALAALIARAQV